VKSLSREKPGGGFYSLNRHGTGHVEHQFYTAYDYPVRVDFTEMFAEEKKANLGEQLLKVNVRNYATTSQGFVVETNDMHGKPNGQYVYAHGQDDYLSVGTYVYDHDPVDFNQNAPGGLFTTFERHQTKLNNDVPVIHPDGKISKKQIGIDFDIINDFRESKTKSVNVGLDINIATFMIGPVPAIIPTGFPDVAIQKTRYRSVSTTKVINRFGVVREVISHDKGASVSTRNLAWDSETGEVLLTQTMNEYGDKYYSLSYPAHWAYKGMQQAYQNVHAGFEVDLNANGVMTNISSGPITSVDAVFTPGDEVVAYDNVSSSFVHYWVSENYELLKESGEVLIPTTQQLGAPQLLGILRSGHRNMQARSMGGIVMKVNPIDKNNDNTLDIQIPLLKSAANQATYQVLEASAQQYSDDWPIEYCNCDFNPEEAPTFNPYLTNSRGVWRELAAYKYLDNDQTNRNRTQAAAKPNLRYDGMYSTFIPFWSVNASNKWGINSTNWIAAQKASKYSPYGVLLETKDPLNRYSASQLNYNNIFITAVSNNARYQQIGFDNFEEYQFDNCENDHFSFEKGIRRSNGAGVTTTERAHTGRYSIKVMGGKEVKMRKRLEACD
jgi:hypothetical protein